MGRLRSFIATRPLTLTDLRASKHRFVLSYGAAQQPDASGNFGKRLEAFNADVDRANELPGNAREAELDRLIVELAKINPAALREQHQRWFREARSTVHLGLLYLRNPPEPGAPPFPAVTVSRRDGIPEFQFAAGSFPADADGIENALTEYNEYAGAFETLESLDKYRRAIHQLIELGTAVRDRAGRYHRELELTMTDFKAAIADLLENREGEQPITAVTWQGAAGSVPRVDTATGAGRIGRGAPEEFTATLAAHRRGSRPLKRLGLGRIAETGRIRFTLRYRWGAVDLHGAQHVRQLEILVSAPSTGPQLSFTATATGLTRSQGAYLYYVEGFARLVEGKAQVGKAASSGSTATTPSPPRASCSSS
jgi:hypothetical protein